MDDHSIASPMLLTQVDRRAFRTQYGLQNTLIKYNMELYRLEVVVSMRKPRCFYMPFHYLGRKVIPSYMKR